MELDVLYDHIASPTVVADFPALAQRIANKELAHGADLIVGIHTRLLKSSHPSRLKSAPLPRHTPWPPGLVRAEVNTRDAPRTKVEVEDPMGLPRMEPPSIQLCPPSNGVAAPCPPPPPFVNMRPPTAINPSNPRR